MHGGTRPGSDVREGVVGGAGRRHPCRYWRRREEGVQGARGCGSAGLIATALRAPAPQHAAELTCCRSHCEALSQSQTHVPASHMRGGGDSGVGKRDGCRRTHRTSRRAESDAKTHASTRNTQARTHTHTRGHVHAAAPRRSASSCCSWDTWSARAPSSCSACAERRARTPVTAGGMTAGCAPRPRHTHSGAPRSRRGDRDPRSPVRARGAGGYLVDLYARQREQDERQRRHPSSNDAHGAVSANLTHELQFLGQLDLQNCAHIRLAATRRRGQGPGSTGEHRAGTR